MSNLLRTLGPSRLLNGWLRKHLTKNSHKSSTKVQVLSSKNGTERIDPPFQENHLSLRQRIFGVKGKAPRYMKPFQEKVQEGTVGSQFSARESRSGSWSFLPRCLRGRGNRRTAKVVPTPRQCPPKQNCGVAPTTSELLVFDLEDEESCLDLPTNQEATRNGQKPLQKGKYGNTKRPNHQGDAVDSLGEAELTNDIYGNVSASTDGRGKQSSEETWQQVRPQSVTLPRQSNARSGRKRGRTIDGFLLYEAKPSRRVRTPSRQGKQKLSDSNEALQTFEKTTSKFRNDMETQHLELTESQTNKCQTRNDSQRVPKVVDKCPDTPFPFTPSPREYLNTRPITRRGRRVTGFQDEPYEGHNNTLQIAEKVCIDTWSNDCEENEDEFEMLERLCMEGCDDTECNNSTVDEEGRGHMADQLTGGVRICEDPMIAKDQEDLERLEAKQKEQWTLAAEGEWSLICHDDDEDEANTNRYLLKDEFEKAQEIRENPDKIISQFQVIGVVRDFQKMLSQSTSQRFRVERALRQYARICRGPVPLSVAGQTKAEAVASLSVFLRRQTKKFTSEPPCDFDDFHKVFRELEVLRDRQDRVEVFLRKDLKSQERRTKLSLKPRRWQPNLKLPQWELDKDLADIYCRFKTKSSSLFQVMATILEHPEEK